ncbi:PLP-dependent aminotransferase family protein, partial [Actinotalea sp.]|uniref:aminotransferase-like domain-containing protein n=1 Tax=Actinotalea sp. TaxID=1872145 RepID=UPI0035672F43
PRHLTGTGYTFLGLPELRTALAERYTRRGTPTSPDEILVTTGAQQAIYLVLASFVGPGERVVVEHPAYPHAISAVRGVGGRPVPVPVGVGGVDLDLLESTIRQSAPRVVHLTPDFHNPTGTSLDAAARERLREIAARHRTLVVGDETLTDLALDGAGPPCFLGAAPGPHLLAIGSASKSFWGGLRVGWVRARRDVVARLGQERARHDLSTGLLDQLVTLELLGEQETVLAERRAELRGRRDALVAALARELPWTHELPAGGLSLWADLGAPLSSTLAAVAPQHGVLVSPGTIFGVDGAFENRMRLPFSADVDRIDRGVAALAAAWHSLDAGSRPGRRPQDAVLV